MYHHFINYHYRYNLNNFYWKSADFHDIIRSLWLVGCLKEKMKCTIIFVQWQLWCRFITLKGDNLNSDEKIIGWTWRPQKKKRKRFHLKLLLWLYQMHLIRDQFNEENYFLRNGLKFWLESLLLKEQPSSVLIVLEKSIKMRSNQKLGSITRLIPKQSQI
jgi:hypothetical protein